jgi:anti-sigma-K factor RskA
MIRDHELIDELLAIRALGGLDGDDRSMLERELAAHGDCDECRRLEAEHREVAGLLPYALDDRPVPDEMVDRILSQPRRTLATAAVPPDEVAAARDARVGRWRAAFGVAAAVAVLLAIVLATRPGAEVVPQRFVRFEGSQGELAMAYTPGRSGIVIWGTGLADPGAGKVYELWMIEGGSPTRGACLSAKDGAIAAYLDADVSTSEQMAVTLESPACPDAPTSDPVYTASLA